MVLPRVGGQVLWVLGCKHWNDASKSNHKRHDEAFELEAVEHWLVSGKSARQIVGELGLNQQSL